jgi:hypothetical protein
MSDSDMNFNSKEAIPVATPFQVTPPPAPSPARIAARPNGTQTLVRGPLFRR